MSLNDTAVTIVVSALFDVSMTRPIVHENFCLDEILAPLGVCGPRSLFGQCSSGDVRFR